MKKFSIIVAMDEKAGIGRAGALPWHIPEDLLHFKEITSREYVTGKKNVVIMGRKTWESLPEKVRPLPGRQNVVITSDPSRIQREGVMFFSNLETALGFFFGKERAFGEIFVIGGARVIAEALSNSFCSKLYITRVRGDHQCDVFLPPISPDFVLIRKSEILESGGQKFFFEERDRSKENTS
ncbi:MAG: dihydrofolate reductase [Elusimicrobia bacterium]|nr:dihydrofolate reductase [Elusimicrobiota bacterium]